MKKRTLPMRIRYRFDCMMSKGPVAMSVLLFAVTAAIVAVIGIAAYLISNEGSILYHIWNSLMYTLDAGTLSGVATDNILYLILMFLVTLCGLFLTSVLIGIITTGVEAKLRDLRKGTSVVLENNHTIVIGFDNNVYTILRELIEANSNKKDACVVVLGDCPKEEMEDAISANIPDFRTTRIICRSGKLHGTYALERCSVETSKSVIINICEDTEIIKVLLALSAYIRDKQLTNQDLRYVVTLEDNQYIEAAKIAGEGRAEIIYAKDAIARIISNTCRQHGLSQVLTELFNFIGNELYFEKVPDLTGKTFREAVLSFSNAIAVGVFSNGKAYINPDMDTIIAQEDYLILLELDDGSYRYHTPKIGNDAQISNAEWSVAKTSDHLFVLGSNEKLPIILAEYEKYVSSGANVVIADDDLEEESLGSYEKLQIALCKQPITRDMLYSFLNGNFHNVLLLNDNSMEPEASDSQTLLRLILLRDIADRTGLHFAITTEMRSADNQRLASQARVDDFVIGSDFTCLLMVQISENPQLTTVIMELLDEKGSEFYIKPIADYVSVGIPVDGYTLAESAARKGEIFVGYRQVDDTKKHVVVNPNKEDTVVFGDHDQIVVISKG